MIALDEPRELFPEDPHVVFHGTRCPREIIEEKGLCWDRGFLCRQVEDFSRRLFIRLSLWVVAEKGYYDYGGDGPGLWSRLTGDHDTRRQRIWVTDSYMNALSYSKHNPEILMDAFTSLYHFKYPRRRSESFYRELDSVVLEALQKIGSRKVVCIDNTHPGVRARAGVNAMAMSGSVPREAVLAVIDVDEGDDRHHLRGAPTPFHPPLFKL